MKLKAKYGQKVLIMIHQGHVQEYLGMTIDYLEDGKVKFLMTEYVEGILEEAPEDMDGKAVMPAAAYMFNV
jgi:hypothetical protein